MTPEKRAALEQSLNDHGLTVSLTSDHNALLLELARLARFERLLSTAGEDHPLVKYWVLRAREDYFKPVESRPLEVLDIPAILCQVNRQLQEQLDHDEHIRPGRLAAATAAFIGILTGQAGEYRR